MITDDPIRDLERQLVRAAASVVHQADGRPGRSPRRRRRIAVATAGGLVSVAAALIVALVAGHGSRLSPADAAAAQLSPAGNRIVHLTYTTTFFDGRAAVRRARVSTWYSSSVTRTVAATIDAQGRADSTLETVARRGTITTYESNRNILTIETLCSRRSRRLTDPVARLRHLLGAGRLTDDGTQQLRGMTVRRLRTSAGPLNVIFLVRPADGSPVAMTTDVAGVDRTLVRFTGYRRFEVSPAADRRLVMAPHPTSHVVRVADRCR